MPLRAHAGNGTDGQRCFFSGSWAYGAITTVARRLRACAPTREGTAEVEAALCKTAAPPKEHDTAPSPRLRPLIWGDSISNF